MASGRPSIKKDTTWYSRGYLYCNVKSFTKTDDLFYTVQHFEIKKTFFRKQFLFENILNYFFADSSLPSNTSSFWVSLWHLIFWSQSEKNEYQIEADALYYHT